jgi:hypothetical protein
MWPDREDQWEGRDDLRRGLFRALAVRLRRLTVAANLTTQNQAMLFVERDAASSGGAAW